MPSDSSVHRQSPGSTILPVASLYESPTNPRKYFDAKALAQLAESVKEHGVLEPLIVRANGESLETEIICGARRYRAAKLAGLAEVPVIVREFTEEEIVIIQLVENGQRADISPLEEAETYAGLAEKGLAVSAIAKRVGRESRDVARRLPLANLPKRVKSALSTGVLPVEHAQLIARIPDAKLQEEALKRVLEEYFTDADKPLVQAVPYAVAKRLIEQEFMTALSLAVFDPDDADLSPLGACSKCPQLAGNNPDLFGDVKGKAVCTNPKDFRLKTENHLKRLRETGYTVLLSPKELKRAFPFGESDQVGKEFVDLERVAPEDPKHRRYEELLARAEKLKTVFAFKTGRVRMLYPAKELKNALVASGHAFAKDKQKRTTDKQAAQSAANLERIGQDAVSRELAAKLRAVKLTPAGWIDLVIRCFIVVEAWKLEGVLRRHGFDGSSEEFAKNRERIVAERLETMTDAEKRAFLVDLTIGGLITSADKAQQELYRYVLKLAGVEYAKVANSAIDAAKRKATESKQTQKPPIAAKTVRLPKQSKTT
ncbi:MAG TPA: ParB/RepB/Spo0J family partition protein [Thermoanaerobaculia bacterium]|jgi:ParB/RepB/Spo0J family partition protein|nr:ParB/RepB/Spo0J family partition protein [Thermoanaerobaculia bacterium]